MKRGRDILSRLEITTNLPTLSPVIERLRVAVLDPNTGAKQVRAIVEDDPAMSARILKVVNSPLFSGWGIFSCWKAKRANALHDAASHTHSAPARPRRCP